MGFITTRDNFFSGYIVQIRGWIAPLQYNTIEQAEEAIDDMEKNGVNGPFQIGTIERVEVTTTTLLGSEELELMKKLQEEE